MMMMMMMIMMMMVMMMMMSHADFPDGNRIYLNNISRKS